MRKTYYTVDYKVYGDGRLHVATFDNKEKAMEFSDNTEYNDGVVAHNVSNEDTIQKYNDAVRMTILDLDPQC